MKPSILRWAFIAIAVTMIAGSFVMKQTSKPETLNDISITLHRKGCHGICPAYKIVITGDGTVTYEGFAFVGKAGVQNGKISEAQVRELLKQFEAIDYFNLKDVYEKNIPTESGATETSLTLNGKTKTILRWDGAQDAPIELQELETAIDRAVNSDQWTRE